MKEIYYYVRGRKKARLNVRLATVCILTENGEHARGIAICSDRDQFCKKTGRDIAKGRAEKALRLKRTYGFLHYPFNCKQNIPTPAPYKGEWMPTWSQKESRLIDRYLPEAYGKQEFRPVQIQEPFHADQAQGSQE